MVESSVEYSHHVEECYHSEYKETPLVGCWGERTDEPHDHRYEYHE